MSHSADHSGAGTEVASATQCDLLLVGYSSHAMTGRLHRTLLKRGHACRLVHPDELVTSVSDGVISVFPRADGSTPDAVVLTVSTDHVPAVHSAAQLERTGVPVLNRPAAVLQASDKVQTALALASAGVPVPRMVSVATVDAALEHAGLIGYPLVLKAADGAEGNQVRLVPDAARLPNVLRELPTSMGQEASHRSPLVLQELLSRSLGRDRRLFVVGGVVQAAMDRTARVGEWRSNLSQGATPEPAVATAREIDIAERAARALRLDFTTVDLMDGDKGPVVIEANPYGDILDVGMTAGVDLVGSVADLVEMTAGARPIQRIRPRPLTRSAHERLTEFCLHRLRTKMRELTPDPLQHR